MVAWNTSASILCHHDRHQPPLSVSVQELCVCSLRTYTTHLPQCHKEPPYTGTFVKMSCICQLSIFLCFFPKDSKISQREIMLPCELLHWKTISLSSPLHRFLCSMRNGIVTELQSGDIFLPSVCKCHLTYYLLSYLWLHR